MNVSKSPTLFSLCQSCQKPFFQSTIPQKCSRCRILICSRCSTSSPSNPVSSPCTLCNQDLLNIEQLKANYEPFWNHNSKLALKWLDSCKVSTELHNTTSEDYKQYISLFETDHKFKTVAEELNNEISQGRADPEAFNYSLYQFMVDVQVGHDKNEIRSNVERVLKAFYARHSYQVYNPLLLAPVALLLCFADEETSFWMLNYLAEELLPSYFWNPDSSVIPFSGLLRREYVIFKTILGEAIPAKSHKTFQVLYNKVIHVLLGSLTVDMMNLSTTINIWDQMFTLKTYKMLESNIIKILKCSWERFENKAYSISLFEYRLFTLRAVQHEALEKMNSIEVSQEEEYQILEEFEETVLDQIVLTKKGLTDALDAFKDLSDNDLKEISNKLNELTTPITIITPLGEHIQKESTRMVREDSFVLALLEAPSLKQLGEKNLADIFQTLVIYRDEAISVQILNGILALCTSGDLELRLSRFFDSFDMTNQGVLNIEEATAAIEILQKVLCLVNEANSDYINFHIQVCEMVSRLKKRMKKEEKVTREDFQRLVAKYAALKALPGILSKHIRRVGSTDSFVSVEDVDSPNDYEIMNELDFSEVDTISDRSRASPELILAERKDLHLELLDVRKLELGREKSGEDTAYIVDNLSLESPGKGSERDVGNDFEEVKEEKIRDIEIEEIPSGSEPKSLNSACIVLSGGDNEEKKNLSMEAVIGEAEVAKEEIDAEIQNQHLPENMDQCEFKPIEEPEVEAPIINVEIEHHNDAEVGVMKEGSSKPGSVKGSSSGPESEHDGEAAVEEAIAREDELSHVIRATPHHEGAERNITQIEVEINKENRQGMIVSETIRGSASIYAKDERRTSSRITEEHRDSERKTTCSTAIELRDDCGDNMNVITNRNLIKSEIKEVKGAIRVVEPQRRPVRRPRQQQDECVLCNIF